MTQKIDTLDLDFLSKWKSILSGIDMAEVPIGLLEKISIVIVNGNVVEIDAKSLLAQGSDPKALEQAIYEKLSELSDQIEDVFYDVDVSAVAEAASRATNEALKDL